MRSRLCSAVMHYPDRNKSLVVFDARGIRRRLASNTSHFSITLRGLESKKSKLWGTEMMMTRCKARCTRALWHQPSLTACPLIYKWHLSLKRIKIKLLITSNYMIITAELKKILHLSNSHYKWMQPIQQSHCASSNGFVKLLYFVKSNPGM